MKQNLLELKSINEIVEIVRELKNNKWSDNKIYEFLTERKY